MSPTPTNRERMLATLAGEILDYVPSWTMGFYNQATMRNLLPAELLVPDLGCWPEHGAYGFTAQTPAELDQIIAFNQHIDRIGTAAGRGANGNFGHAGPGEFNSRVISQEANMRVIEYETGARARVQSAPHFYHLFDMPVKTLADADALTLPAPDRPERWTGFAEEVAYLKERGEYTVGWVNGFFSGCHYFFCDYQELMAAMVWQPEMVQVLADKLGAWNLRAAQHMLDAGVDCIGFVDDLGSGANLLFRPDLYRRYFWPWHRALVELVHGYGRHVHMHSHGNINKVLDLIVETGVDMLNPLDPTEGMDLGAIKERYGGRLTLVCGMDKYIFDQELDEIEARLCRTVATGARGGRFILMDTGGIPEDLSRENYDAFRAISRRARGQV
jgi:uroporphyrinogen decarboxylase